MESIEVVAQRIVGERMPGGVVEFSEPTGYNVFPYHPDPDAPARVLLRQLADLIGWEVFEREPAVFRFQPPTRTVTPEMTVRFFERKTLFWRLYDRLRLFFYGGPIRMTGRRGWFQRRRLVNAMKQDLEDFSEPSTARTQKE